MLVFTRKCRQAVVIEGCGGAAQRLTVTVVAIRGGRVKLGFEVAGDVPAHRAEVWTRINGNDPAGNWPRPETPPAGTGSARMHHNSPGDKL